MIYLDHAATSYPKKEKVYRMLDRLNRDMAVSAGRGMYRKSRDASRLIENVRKKMSGILDWDSPQDIYFTASATEAANRVLLGIEWKMGQRIYLSYYEHNAVARVVEHLRRIYKLQVDFLPVDRSGQIDLAATEKAFQNASPDLVCITMVSNVTGYILPVQQLAMLAHKYGGCVVADASQALGVIPVSLQKIKADYVIFTGHKALGGPMGVGGFVKCCDRHLLPVIFGGNGRNSLSLEMPPDGSERYEVGTMNVPAIGALGEALENLPAIQQTLSYERKLIHYAEAGLASLGNIKCYQRNIKEEYMTGIISISVAGYDPAEVAEILDREYDIAVRSGYHCAPYIHKIIGSSRAGTVRISVGDTNTYQEIDMLISALCTLA
ncbi:MAG: aminotransferase class V-fold PLP-dependent enzyme [Lachnospiraceae bacterium]|nr:aminotransferase class V-fold PLP-dependent enzyme [Lachnospiraceae bacterium]